MINISNLSFKNVTNDSAKLPAKLPTFRTRKSPKMQVVMAQTHNVSICIILILFLIDLTVKYITGVKIRMIPRA